MGKDKILVGLVRRLESGAVSLPFDLTLYLSGVVVSGVLVSEEDYLEACLRMLEDAVDRFVTDEFAASVRENLTERGLPGADRMSKEEIIEKAGVPGKLMRDLLGVYELQADSPDYIHLVDADITAIGADETFKSGAWRCRIDAVDGFSLGSVSKS